MANPKPTYIFAMISFKKICATVFFFALAISLQAQSIDTFDLNETYSIDADGSISLSSDDAEVTITGSDRSDIHVEVHYKLEVTGFSFGSRNKFDMQVTERGGELIIEEQPRDFNGVTFGSTREEYTIRIEAPHGVSLELQGDDENYEIREMEGDIAIDADDAQARLMACRGNHFSFGLDDGSVVMDEGSGSLTIDADDGEADIRNGNFDEITLDADDGDFAISTALSDTGSYSFDMDDGNLVFRITGGGGRFTVRHDNADISANSAFRQTLDEENEDQYELPAGSASVQIDVDDANIQLRAD